MKEYTLDAALRRFAVAFGFGIAPDKLHYEPNNVGQLFVAKKGSRYAIYVNTARGNAIVCPYHEQNKGIDPINYISRQKLIDMLDAMTNGKRLVDKMSGMFGVCCQPSAWSTPHKGYRGNWD